MLACTLATFALCATPQPSVIAVGGLAVPITWTRVATDQCGDAGGAASGEAGHTEIGTEAFNHRTGGADGYRGRVVIRLQGVSIHLIAFTWPKMSTAEDDAMHRLYEATLWHELGHVRTALDSVAAIDAEPDFSAPTAAAYQALADQQTNAALERVDDDQNAYERAVSHGLRQATLPSPLGGPDTMINCPYR